MHFYHSALLKAQVGPEEGICNRSMISLDVSTKILAQDGNTQYHKSHQVPLCMMEELFPWEDRRCAYCSAQACLLGQAEGVIPCPVKASCVHTCSYQLCAQGFCLSHPLTTYEIKALSTAQGDTLDPTLIYRNGRGGFLQLWFCR